MKKKVSILMLCFLALAAVACGGDSNEKREKAFTKAVKKVEQKKVTMEELVPFEWDKLYSFPPYTDTEEIAEQAGVEESEVSDTMANEGLTYLLFEKEGNVVGKVYGHPKDLGYGVDFGEYDEACIEIKNGDDTSFTVEKEDGIIYLTMVK